eukprot:763020-Hanusia_phi.AAC.1
MTRRRLHESRLRAPSPYHDSLSDWPHDGDSVPVTAAATVNERSDLSLRVRASDSRQSGRPITVTARTGSRSTTVR